MGKKDLLKKIIDDKEKYEFYKQLILHYLKNDDDVKNTIGSIKVDNSQIKADYESKIQDLENQIVELKDENDKLERDMKLFKSEKNKEIERKDKEISRLKEDISSFESRIEKLEDIISEKNNAIENLLNIYGSLESAYKKYINLPLEVKRAYDPIIKSDSPVEFAVSGSDSESIQLMFEKICMEWKKYEQDTLYELNAVFDFLFEMFRVNNPSYSRIVTEIGEGFSSERHSRTSDSSPVGKVTQVIIAGYANESGSKKIKSFVRIG